MDNQILPENRYGSWTVVGRGDLRGKSRLVRVVCDCGTQRQLQKHSLVYGKSQSCGCKFSEKIKKANTRHGHTGTTTYETWRSMRQRCSYKKGNMYYLYGGNGIAVCERWNVFENFLADMGERPENTSIDRIDGTKGYSPDNCRWASPREQAINRSTTRHDSIEYNGKIQSLAQWAEDFGIASSVLYARIVRMGWNIEEALTKPVKRYKK